MLQFDLFDETQNRIFESPTYEIFKERLTASNCQRCTLSESRTHIVCDRGSPQAKIVIIGEAPGENEDRLGKAFVGRAGKLLDELLKEIGIDSDKDTLILNIVKCRPPENRAPRQEEAKTCLPYLKKQIDLVKPRIILLLGATALKYLVKETASFSMEEAAGKLFYHQEFPGVSIMVLYHPAYLLYDPRKTDVLKQHLRHLRKSLVDQKITPFDPENPAAA